MLAKAFFITIKRSQFKAVSRENARRLNSALFPEIVVVKGLLLDEHIRTGRSQGEGGERVAYPASAP
jgi:hypothetical protein